MIKIDGMDNGNRGHAPAQPAVAHIIHRAERVTAFPHDDSFHPQPGGRFKMGAFDAAHDLVIAGVHGHVAVVPAGRGRHRPVDTGDIHNDSRLVDKLGLKLRFRADYRIHDVGALFFQGNP